MQGGRRECRKPHQTLYLNDGRYYKRLPVRVFDIRFFFSDSHYDSLPLIAFLSGYIVCYFWDDSDSVTPSAALQNSPSCRTGFPINALGLVINKKTICYQSGLLHLSFLSLGDDLAIARSVALVPAICTYDSWRSTKHVPVSLHQLPCHWYSNLNMLKEVHFVSFSKSYPWSLLLTWRNFRAAGCIYKGISR